MKEQLAIQKILQTRLTTLRAKNASYSLRAFSRKVGLSAGTLSLIMLGKRSVSRKLAETIVQNLMLDPQERSEILDLFPARMRHGSTNSLDGHCANYLQLTADQFHLVGDWYYFAILNLLNTHGCQSDPAWIAMRLGLNTPIVFGALERLKRLEMIVETPQGRLKRVSPRYRTTDDVANISVRRSHHQSLELAQVSLDKHSVDERDFTWLTLPMDTRRVALAKQLIRKFQDEFLETMGADGARPDEVYRMAIQFFPLTQKIQSQTKPKGKSV